jgi:serine/threonine-protein kinase
MRAALSPDNRWVAYHGDETGRMEVYVRPFPAVGSRKWQVSHDGGVEPRWSPKGGELFFVSAATQQLMRVPVSGGETWAPGPASVVFTDRYFWGTMAGAAAATYDISADGRRFLMIRPVREGGAEAQSGRLIVVQNWLRELERLVP